MNKEFDQLNRKWRKLKGEDIPSEIASQEIAVIRRAVSIAEKGDHGFIPIARQTKVEDTSSMRDWDCESNN